MRRRYRRSVTAFEQEPTDFLLPADLVAGVYASVVNAWFSQHEFTLDFAAPSAQDDGFILTARVRLPPTAIFEAIRHLSGQLASYELHFGEIRIPRRKGER